MPRILTGNTTKGRPGGFGRTFKGKFAGGRLIQVNKVSASGVRRLFARDPSKRTALIGTSKDVNPNVKLNTVAQQRPRVLSDSSLRASSPPGQARVVNRSKNRNVRRTNS